MQRRKCIEHKRMRRLLFQTRRTSHGFYGDHSRFAKQRGGGGICLDLHLACRVPILRSLREGRKARPQTVPRGWSRGLQARTLTMPMKSPHTGQQIVILRTRALVAPPTTQVVHAVSGAKDLLLAKSKKGIPIVRASLASEVVREPTRRRCAEPSDNSAGDQLSEWLRRGPGEGRVRGCFG